MANVKSEKKEFFMHHYGLFYIKTCVDFSYKICLPLTFPVGLDGF